MSTLCSTWSVFLHFFPHETILFTSRSFTSFPFYFSLIFSLIFFFYCLLWVFSVISRSFNTFCFFHYNKSRATMYESILKILSSFTFFFDVTYKTLHGRGFVWKEKKGFFYLIRCWFIFFYIIDKGFYPICEILFCGYFWPFVAECGWVWPFLAGCGQVWVGLTFFWLAVGGYDLLWLAVGVTFFLAGCVWVWVSVAYFWLGVGGCGWVHGL